jgi:hypothetical protein
MFLGSVQGINRESKRNENKGKLPERLSRSCGAPSATRAGCPSAYSSIANLERST